MSDIVLFTQNARHAHCAFGLRCLQANLGALASQSTIVESTLDARPVDDVEQVLARDPKIVGVGVYIWNANEALAFVRTLKKLRPDVIVVVGGPEVSYETDQQEICGLADVVVTGEGDVVVEDLFTRLLAGKRPLLKVVEGGKPPLDGVVMPYALYTDDDIAHRTVYVEASRGCVFKCEFCLSSLDKTVRAFAVDAFLAEMQKLFDRGLRQFKFVDRTFNLSPTTSTKILRFFLERYQPGLFLHFEMVPDRLPEELRTLLAQFPAGAVQLEVGIQTFDEATGLRISRKNDASKIADNLRFLVESTGIHIHSDLIAGLPGEDLTSFARGFDRLFAMRPHEIQVGILKRLRGTPIIRHDAEWGMRYSDAPPYEILQTKVLPFNDVQRIKRFARAFDLIGNRGRFPRTMALLVSDASPFARIMQFADWLALREKAVHGIALSRLADLLFRFLVDDGTDAAVAAAAIEADVGRDRVSHDVRALTGPAVPKRQAHHLHARPHVAQTHTHEGTGK